MTDLISFNFDDDPVRVLELDGAPWWIASDIASILGYRDAANVVRNIDDDEADTHNVSTSSQRREMTIISESGLYHAIFSSRKPEAKRFRRWVTGTLLPAFRRHGRYCLPGLAETPETAADFESAKLSASVAAVREARRLFGPQSARIIWTKLGLPLPLAQSAAGLNADPLAADLRPWLDQIKACTIEEAAEMLGIRHLDGSTRLRIGALLRLMGWFPKKTRRGRVTVNLFTPLQDVFDAA